MLGQGEKIAGGIKCVVHQNAASQPQALCPATIIQHGYCSRNFHGCRLIVLGLY